MQQGDGTHPENEVPTCDICGQEATKRIFSQKGAWKLCDRPSCLSRLQSRHPQSGLTWLKTPLDEDSPGEGPSVTDECEEPPGE